MTDTHPTDSQPTDTHPKGRRDPLHPEINEELIKTLVYTFYDRVREDETLGPIFDNIIKDNWDAHLGRMCTFWGAIALKTGDYKGRPVPKHVAISELTPDHFKIWLRLFRITAIDVCGRDIGLHFIDRGEKIAESLQLACFFRGEMAPIDAFKNGELQTPLPEPT